MDTTGDADDGVSVVIITEIGEYSAGAETTLSPDVSEVSCASSPETTRKNRDYVDVAKHLRITGLQTFKKHYGVSYRRSELGYVLDVLPGTPHHPLTDMCKDLVVTEDLSQIVARGFDRIPKADAQLMESFGMEPEYRLYEKVDGVLVRIFYFGGKWHVAQGNSDNAKQVLPCGALRNDNYTYQDLIFDALHVERCCYTRFHKICSDLLDRNMTYLLQLASPDLQNVTSYAIATVTLLAVRHTRTGRWVEPSRDATILFCQLNAVHPDRWTGKNIKTLMEGLTPKNPGFVVYKRLEPLFVAENKRFKDLYEVRHDRSSNLDKKIRMFLEGSHADYVVQYPQECRVFDVMKGLLEKLIDKMKTFKREIAATSFDAFMETHGRQDYTAILESECGVCL